MKTYKLDDVHEMAGGDEEFITEMVQTFVEELPEDVKAMNEAVDNENAQLTFQIAHKMKPNLQIFGLDLAYQVKMLEQWANKSLTRSEVMLYANQITETVLQACKELKEDFNIE